MQQAGLVGAAGMAEEARTAAAIAIDDRRNRVLRILADVIAVVLVHVEETRRTIE